jgi:hypothetical protein
MRAAGASPQDIEQALASRRPPEHEVWPENWATWRTWLELATQWRLVAGVAGVIHQGIEFASVPLALELAGVTADERPDVLRGLKDMEQAALAVFNEAKEEDT